MGYKELSDDELTIALCGLARDERNSVAALIACLAEFDTRKSYIELGFTSLFRYCTRVLLHSESAASKRICAARLVQRYPYILRLLEKGEIHLEALMLLSPHLTGENHRALIAEAKGMGKRDLEFRLAALAPRPDVADSIRIVNPASRQPAASADPEALPLRLEKRPVIEPLSAERVRIAFTASKELLAKIERAKDLMCHKYPFRQMEGIMEEAYESLLDRVDPDRRIARKEKRAAARVQRSGLGVGLRH